MSAFAITADEFKAPVLVTGAAGFIGSAFCRHASSVGMRVVPFDLMTPQADARNLPHFDIYKGDVRSAGDLTSAVLAHGARSVVHFAAESHVDRAEHAARDFVSTNIVGTQTVIDVCLALDLPFVYISTDEVYGSCERGAARQEGDPMSPRNAYAASKAAGEMLVRAAGHVAGLRYLITRSTNNYGPYQHPEKFIPRAITSALKHSPIRVYGHGAQQRDWLYVDDNARAVYYLLRHGRAGHTYNIGTGEVRTNLEVANAVAEIARKYDLHPRIEFVDDRAGHDFVYRVNCGALETTGFRLPVVADFADLLRDTFAWYAQHPAWWEGKTA